MAMPMSVLMSEMASAPGGLGGAGDLGDIGDVGRELDDERAGGGLAAHADHLLDGLHVRADGHAAGHRRWGTRC